MAPNEYLYFFTTSKFLATTSVTTMSAMAANRMTSWLIARLGLTRVTKVMPMPDSANTIGKIAGSAPGAKMRTAICAAAKAAKRPSGTARVWNVSAVPVLTTNIA